jgi:hypothetical protein
MAPETLTLKQLPEFQESQQKAAPARTDNDRMLLDIHAGVSNIMAENNLSKRDVELLLILKCQQSAIMDVYKWIETEKIDVIQLSVFRDIHGLCKQLGLKTEDLYLVLMALQKNPALMDKRGLGDLRDTVIGITKDRFVPSIKDIPESLLEEGPRKAFANQLNDLLNDEETRQKLLDAGYSLEELEEMMANGDTNSVLQALAKVGAIDAGTLMKNLFGDGLPPGALNKQTQSLLDDPLIRAQLLEKGYSIEELEQMIKDGNASEVMLILTKEGIADMDTWTKMVDAVEEDAIFVKTGLHRTQQGLDSEKKV